MTFLVVFLQGIFQTKLFVFSTRLATCLHNHRLLAN